MLPRIKLINGKTTACSKKKDPMPNYSFRIAAIFGLLSVVLGAFGAHGLKTLLIENDSIEIWKTAVDYQMWHALALLAMGYHGSTRIQFKAASACFSLGVLLFSGSLYWLALAGPRWLGPVTPIGGLLLTFGWALLLQASWKGKHQE